MTKKLHQLEQIRRERDWSYRELSDAIEKATLFRRNQDCWRRICQFKTPKPNDRTQDAMARFYAKLAAVTATKRQRAS